MEEHIFGTYATDELKLAHHRAMRTGIQHRHQLDPASPLPGQPVTLSVRLGPELDASGMACYYTTDGSDPEGGRGRARHGAAVPLACVDVVWDSLVWDYLTLWRGTLPAQPEGTTVRYRIGAWADDGAETFADWPDAQRVVDQAAEAFFHERPRPDVLIGDPGAGTIFTYRAARAAPPAWAANMIMYEVFVDRFYPGDGREWLQTEDVSGFCGGTLQGIADKLDYITGLGCTALWLTPIFPSPSHHGYDATDYTRVAERLGGDAGLRILVEAAHARGVRVVLDLVCNHISNQHPIFVDALKNPASPYRAWFTFDAAAPAGYRAFFGVQQMPQLNLANPGARDWMLDIARYWLREFDVDGYRLDYGNGPGPDFWVDFSAACKAVKPDCFNFGEIVEAPDVVRTYVGRLDGNLDFNVETALRRTFAFGSWSPAQYARFLKRHYAYFPPEFIQPTFLDNHDTDRFLFVAGGDKARLKRAAAAQMRLPAPPIIYYGTEVGLSQTRSKRGLGLEVSRAVMPWGDEQDADLLAFYQEIIRERQAVRAGVG